MSCSICVLCLIPSVRSFAPGRGGLINQGRPLRVRSRRGACGDFRRFRDRRLRTVCVGKVRGPIVHEPPPTLEQVRPRVGRFDLVLHRVRERRLDDLAWVIRFLRRPVSKGGPEAVRPLWNGYKPFS